MLVGNWMTKDVISVDVNDSMQDAARLIRKHKIKRLPVMENNKLVGIVTDRDLKTASASEVTTLLPSRSIILLMKLHRFSWNTNCRALLLWMMRDK